MFIKEVSKLSIKYRTKIPLPGKDPYGDAHDAAHAEIEPLLHTVELANHQEHVDKDDEIAEEQHPGILERLTLQRLEEHAVDVHRYLDVVAVVVALGGGGHERALELKGEAVHLFAALGRAHQLDVGHIDPGDPGDGGRFGAHNVTRGVVADQEGMLLLGCLVQELLLREKISSLELVVS